MKVCHECALGAYTRNRAGELLCSDCAFSPVDDGHEATQSERPFDLNDSDLYWGYEGSCSDCGVESDDFFVVKLRDLKVSDIHLDYCGYGQEVAEMAEFKMVVVSIARAAPRNKRVQALALEFFRDDLVDGKLPRLRDVDVALFEDRALNWRVN